MTKRKIAMVLCVLLLAVANIYIWLFIKPHIEDYVDVDFSIIMDRPENLQFFYSYDGEFTEENSTWYDYSTVGTNDNICVSIPIDTGYFRIDFGIEGSNIAIGEAQFSVSGLNKSIPLTMYECIDVYNDIASISGDGGLVLKTSGDDPYIVLDITNLSIKDKFERNEIVKCWLYRIGLCTVLDLLGIFCLVHFEGVVQIPKCLINNRRMIWELAKNDFQAKFVGAYLGIIWAFVQPIIIMLLYWFVFQVGLRNGNVGDYPFVLYFMSGMIPWFYFSEALGGQSNVLIEYNYLVKKVVFDVRILPIIKLVSALFVHLFFLLFIIVMCWCYGYPPSVYTLQIIYYLLCMMVFTGCLGYVTSASTVFFRDIGQIINIILTIGVWITPIMWSTAGLSPVLRSLFMLNPIFYIVEGYRDALIYHEWFINKPIWGTYFWIITLVIYCIGMRFFNRSRSHFADLL